MDGFILLLPLYRAGRTTLSAERHSVAASASSIASSRLGLTNPPSPAAAPIVAFSLRRCPRLSSPRRLCVRRSRRHLIRRSRRRPHRRNRRPCPSRLKGAKPDYQTANDDSESDTKSEMFSGGFEPPPIQVWANGLAAVFKTAGTIAGKPVYCLVAAVLKTVAKPVPRI
ncbi:hypothetical protein PIB30_027190 [Stylosanthes scabra]|uniref:Uncharacterized protein n=1 Tax=Stylosanthes scabra TaxID=79078 RepID=A0ABU6SAR6_9FABA|nr:hypothetical protein [Stylosanthes scabra]